MTIAFQLASGFAGLLVAGHVASHALAAARLVRRPAVGPSARWPEVTLVRPLCGIETFSRETLEASFALDYPCYELIFCVAQDKDPIAPLVRDAIERHPQVRAKLLVGHEVWSGNPKLDNMAKGYRAATGDFIVFADSNLLTPVDYLQRVIGAFTADSAVVSAPPYGAEPGTFAAEIECALLNAYAARVQYCVDALGFGFAQGKTLAFRKADLDAGAFAAMANEPAEDAAATKWARGLGKKVRLVTPMAPQPLGPRTMKDVWSRHLRWARLRRATFPALFAPEIFSSVFAPMAFAAVAADMAGASIAFWTSLCALIWFAADIATTRLAGWPLSWRTLLALPCRDALLVAIWAAAWAGRSFVWRGHVMEAAAARPDARA